MSLDYSFIRLKPTFTQAVQLGDPRVSDFNYHNVIQLLPNESYLQITNLDSGIAFDGDLKVEIINCHEEILSDVTDNVAVIEFIDENGVNQISFEVAYLNVNFYNEPVFFKFSKTTGSDVWYSNPVLITDDHENETTRFDYKSYNYFHGIDYPRADWMQSIRLKTWYDRPADETEVKDYYQITNGNTISTRALLRETEIYKFDYVNPFVFRASNILLIHDIIYIDGVRMTNKTTLKSSDRLGQSNLMETEFTVSKNHSDIYVPINQIFEPLELIDKSPLGFYTLGTMPTNIIGQFNRPIAKTTGTVKIYNVSDNTLFAMFDESEILITGDGFQIGVTGLFIINGAYYIKISDGLFVSGVEPYAGINNTTDWTFEITDGDFLGTDFNNNDFFTD